ncbi:MAG: hypothetical protein HQM14_04035 [SAR324 cluster bacterium]|nr:hypothetical protein [SAR324 cluster bacterium]
MKRIQLRPRFSLVVPFTSEEVLEIIRIQLAKPEIEFTGKILSGFAILRIPEKEQHYWSPELSLDVEDHENGTLVRCILGPKPAVWTMFASFYGLSIFIGVMGLMFGLSQWSLGLTPYGFWAVLISILFSVVAYGIAVAGQKLGYDQIGQLRSFLEHTLK